MKIRTGFVSNSSSSSYVCDVCREQFSGMDVGFLEFELFECKEGHIFCDEHVIDPCKSCDNDRKSEECNGCQFEEWDEDRHEIPVDACPLCQLSTISDHQALRYFLKKNDIKNREALAEVIAKEFKTDDAFCAWLRGEKD